MKRFRTRFARQNADAVRTETGVTKKSDPGPLKIMAVGDSLAGKTCMIVTYVTEEFPSNYDPTVFEHYTHTIKVDEYDYVVSLWDSGGDEEYDRLRILSYHNTDCFIICFSIGSRTSFQNVKYKWYPEIRHHCPHVPVVLVATKLDLRTDIPLSGEIAVVSNQEARMMRSKIKAAKLVQCSAKSGEGLSDVFIAAVRTAIKYKRKRNRRICALL